MEPIARDVRVFVPARDFEESLRFYAALGWEEKWRRAGLAEIELAGTRLYLQDFYVRDWAENFMIYVEVEDAAWWHRHVTAVLAKGGFPQARVDPPREEPYGALVTYVWDPCGVLLHFAQRVSAES